MKECFVVNILSSIRSKKKFLRLEKIIITTPLQISLWDIDYFIKNIECCKSIWF